jgi:hypothetical protein
MASESPAILPQLRLEAFPKITLEEAAGVSLMNRKDTKYMVPENLLPSLFAELAEHYELLTVKGVVVQSYDGVYYDTPRLQAYHAHHNRHLNRVKLRTRSYLESGITFLEAKVKDNHGQTIKSRTQIPFASTDLPEGLPVLDKVAAHLPVNELQPILSIRFHRIMLASRARGERVSVDLGLTFVSLEDGKEVPMHGLAVIEVKRNAKGEPSPMHLLLKRHKVHKAGFSKFCMAVVHLYPEVKSNAFKKVLLKLRKTTQNQQPIPLSPPTLPR